MSKSIEISDDAYQKLERLARVERRTIPEVVEKIITVSVIRAFD